MSEIDKGGPTMVFPDGCQNDYFVSYIECPKCGKNLGYQIQEPVGAFPILWMFCPGSCRVDGKVLLYGVRYTSVDDIPAAVNEFRDKISEIIDKIDV